MKVDADQRPNVGITWLTLFASTGTLICCALPILLVAFGFGATVAALTDAAPVLITLSRQKGWVFAFSGVMLLLSGWLLYKRDHVCPSEPVKAEMCRRVRVWNKRVHFAASGIWIIGFIAAYLALPFRILLS